MNRLAPHSAAPRTQKVAKLLEHLDDARPEEAATLREWLNDPTFGDKTIADIVTREICRPDNLNFTIGPLAVRNHRENQ